MRLFKFLSKEEPSKKIAVERLRSMIIAEKNPVPANVMALVREDVIKVLKKYLDPDATSLEVRINPDEASTGFEFVLSASLNSGKFRI